VVGVPDVIRSVLIANRGEIAVRIIRTCRDLGIRVVTVHSEADRDSLAVRLADRSMPIGPAEAARSYLDRDRIVAAALDAGVDAVHPGYGFLSEDHVFARQVRDAGLLFVGPSAPAIERMGSKREAKAIARSAGVPVVPGYSGADQSPARLEEEARRIGWPVLVKASGGGGGRGMRVVRRPADLPSAIAEGRREGESFFGDGTLLLERLLESARHIEVQVAGDRHGEIVHLFERDCSIQRRHQKVVEEAPAANLASGVRVALHEAAVKVVRAVGYDSVGTVEFLVDADSGDYWFLEMNTRLQVEHPVTELVTGLDLVALQLRIATGLRLGLSQDDVVLRGAAIEARISAEDPAHDYRPSIGAIGLYRPPAGAGVRVDSGVDQGSTVSPFYDGLLAKVIAFGPDRETARDRLNHALDQWTTAGVSTNAAWLAEVLRHPRFVDGPLTTRYLEETGLDRWSLPPIDGDHVAVATALAASVAESAVAGPWSSLGSWRLGRLGTSSVPLTVELRGHSWPVMLGGNGGRYLVEAAGIVRRVELDWRSADAVRASIDGRMVDLAVRARDGVVFFHLDGVDHVARLAVRREPRVAERQDGPAPETAIVAPLPGVVASVSAAVGQRVARGEVALVIEAMKLVHTLKVGRPGVVRAVHCKAGMTVEGGQLLVELDPTNEETS
jgi:acetyl/propionyl-CoA carboxylase alpha subunit